MQNTHFRGGGFKDQMQWGSDGLQIQKSKHFNTNSEMSLDF